MPISLVPLEVLEALLLLDFFDWYTKGPAGKGMQRELTTTNDDDVTTIDR